jgi:thiol-disulfide isomerase/thioredoxin
MKNILILLIFWGPLSMTAQKVDFMSNLDKAKKMAAKEKKLIFIDFYTDWCKPCKMMDADVFQEGEIADRMNAFFINVKINAENDRFTAGKYDISSYPTSLLVDSMGLVLHRSSGYGGIAPFWKKLEPALATTQSGGYFIVLKAEYEKGRRDAEFLKGYCRLRQMVGLKNELIIDKLIETMPVDSQLVYTPIFIQSVRTFDGKGFDYLLKHKSEKRFPQKIKAVIQLNYQEALAQKDKKKLAKVLDANKLAIENASVSAAENVVLASGFHWTNKNESAYHETVLDYLKNQPTDTAATPLFLQKALDFGDFYFENIKNKKQLTALQTQLTTLNKAVTNANLMKTEAKILYKLDQQEKAISLIEKAKSLAADNADLADVLQKMKDKKL